MNLSRIVLALAALCFCGSHVASAQHQTTELTPINLTGALPYRIEVRPFDFGAAELPTLHSYAAAQYDGKWVLIAGRTNGLHAFDRFSPENNFPPQSQNRDVWVIDLVAKQSWRRSLDDPSAGLTELQANSLTPTNTQFYQDGDRLYMTGGYGVTALNPGGTPAFGTFNTLSAIDLPGIVDWAKGGAGTAASHIRQINDPLVKVTGGAMYKIGGRTHLVFGQDFNGAYTPQTNGAYTDQVRNFVIEDDGVNLSIDDLTTTPPLQEYRRRDLNVYPVVKPGVGQLGEGLVALSGVFTPANGAWTVPVEIDAAGQPTMADPSSPETFKQGFNGYHSAKLGLYSRATGEMHEVLFGGISLQFLDESSGIVGADNGLPFVNDLTAVVIDQNGQFSQSHLGFFPEINDLSGKRLRFGASAEFFRAEGTPTFANGVIDFDALAQGTTLGYIFGGLAANGPHTRGVPGVTSSASNVIFEVVLTRVPEPVSGLLGLGALAWLVALGRRPLAARLLL